jgi:hypothetical protein
MPARRTDSSTELAAMIAKSPELQQQVKDDPVGTLQNLAEPLDTDPWIYRIVVTSLGASAVLVVVFVFVLELKGQTSIPDTMVAIGSAAIAALAALLVPPHR